MMRRCLLNEDLLDDISAADVKHKTVTVDDSVNPDEYSWMLEVCCDFQTNLLRARILTQDLIETTPVVNEWAYDGTRFPESDEYKLKYAEVFYFNTTSDSVYRFFSMLIFPLCSILEKTCCYAVLTHAENEMFSRYDGYHISNYNAAGFNAMRKGAIKTGASDLFLCYAFVVNAMRPDVGCLTMQGCGQMVDLAGAQYDFLFNVMHAPQWRRQFKTMRREDGMTICPVNILMDVEMIDEVPQMTLVKYDFKARNAVSMAVKLQALTVILDDYLCVNMQKSNLQSFWPCQTDIFREMHIDYSVVEKLLILIGDYEMVNVVRTLFKPTYTHKTSFEKNLFNAFDEKIKKIAEMPLDYKLL